MTGERKILAAVAALALATLALVGWRIGVRPLGDWDEALTGARTLGVLETGSFLTVHLNGEPDFHKPPLYYLLAAAAAQLFGATEAAMRAPSVAGAVLVAVLLFLLGRWIDGPIAGFAASLSLLTTPMFVGHARQAQPDMVLYAASLGALLAYLESRPVACGLALAAALLAKGLAGMLAPLVIACWLVLTPIGRLRARDIGFSPRSLTLVVAIPALAVSPWIAWNLLRHPEGFQSTFLGAEVSNRLMWISPFGPLGAYYTSVARDTLGATLGIGLLGLIAVAVRWRSGAPWRRLALVPACLAAAVIALAVTHPKNGHYILIPAIGLALAAGVVVSAIARASPRRSTAGLLALAAASVVLAFSLVSGAALAWTPAPGLALPLASGGAMLLPWASRPAALAAALWAAVLALGAVASLGIVQSDGQPNRDLQLLAPDIQRLVPIDAPLLADRTAIQGVVFYSRRHVVKAGGFFFREPPLPATIYAVLRSDLDGGVAGYHSRALAIAGGLRLVALEADRSPTMPAGPRVFTRGPDSWTVNTLALLGAKTTAVEKGAWVNHVVIGRRGTDGHPLPRNRWQLSAEPPSRKAARALDDQERTSWRVAPVQAPGLSVTLDLGGLERVTRAVLEGDDLIAFPRGLAVAASADGKAWNEVVRVTEFHSGYRLTREGINYRRGPDVEIGFAPIAARYLRFSVTVGAPGIPWSIAEIRVFAE